MNLTVIAFGKNVNRISDTLSDDAKHVAETSMNNAVIVLKKVSNVDVLAIGVSVNGTW